jgi:hypothetical protein
MVVFALILASIALSFRYGFAYKYGAGFILDPLLTAVFLVQVMVMGDSWLWGWLNWSVTRYMAYLLFDVPVSPLSHSSHRPLTAPTFLAADHSSGRVTHRPDGNLLVLSDRTKVPPSEIKIHSASGNRAAGSRTAGSRTAGSRTAGPPRPGGCTRGAPPLAAVQT